MVTIQAPGKLHLIGEHAVVYGYPAIIAAVDKYTTVTAEKAEQVSYADTRFSPQPIRWTRENVIQTTQRIRALWEDGKSKSNFTEVITAVKEEKFGVYRKAAIGIIFQELDIPGGISVTVSGDLAAGSGMGSSASLAIALTKAIAAVYKKRVTLKRANEIAYEIEKIIHGLPSGGDNTACTYGGLLWFIKGVAPVPLKAKTLDGFVIVHSGEYKSSTGELVQKVRALNPSLRDPIMARLGAATDDMRTSLTTGDKTRVRELMNLAQDNLAALGVSTPGIDKIVQAVRKAGGAAKLCGAGGGGIVLCAHADTNKLTLVLEGLGLTPSTISLGVEGVRDV